MRERKEMRAIHQGISWLGVHGIERDLILLHVLVVERFCIMQVTADFGAGRKPFLGEVMVPEILLIFLKRILLNEGAEVIELLGPLVNELHPQKDHAAENRNEHVPPISTETPHLERRPSHHHRDRRRDQDRPVHRADWNVEQSVWPSPGVRIEAEKEV